MPNIELFATKMPHATAVATIPTVTAAPATAVAVAAADATTPPTTPISAAIAA